MRAHPFGVLGILLFALPAAADHGFAPIPPEQPGGKPSGLELRIVRYDGSTNGELVIEVRNPQQQSIEFSARGLYFVPQGNADEAPQRLGAVGPFRLKTEQGWQRRESTRIAPGEIVRVSLDVYCIDSHRGSPGARTAFRMGRTRVPKKLLDSIDRDAQTVAAPLGGMSNAAAKPAVQSQVWKNRDKKWIELDGEGKQEAAKTR